MGSGALFARAELLEAMPPFMAGGDRVRLVEPGRATWAAAPEKFEAGTLAVEEAIGLGVAVDYLRAIGLERVLVHEVRLAERARAGLERIPGMTSHGPADPAFRSGIVSFTLVGLEPVAIAARLDAANIAARAGMHCCHPLFDALRLDGIVRVSFYVYNTEDDADRLVAASDAADMLATRVFAIDPANPCGLPVA